MPDYQIVDYGIEQLQRKHDKPFFLSIGVHKPHMPWNVPRKYFDMHPLDKIELPPTKDDDLTDIPAVGIEMAKPRGDHAAMLESGRWKEAVQAYLAAISYCDAMIGRLIDGLDKQRLSRQHDRRLLGRPRLASGRERTLAEVRAVGRSDARSLDLDCARRDQAGRRLRSNGRLHEHLSHALRSGGRANCRSTSKAKAFARCWPSQQQAWEQPALTTYLFNNHAVRSEGWRYIRYHDGGEELYDEAADPYEWTNLAALPEHAARKAEMAKLMPTENAPTSAIAYASKAEKKQAKQQARYASQTCGQGRLNRALRARLRRIDEACRQTLTHD